MTVNDRFFLCEHWDLVMAIQSLSSSEKVSYLHNLRILLMGGDTTRKISDLDCLAASLTTHEQALNLIP